MGKCENCKYFLNDKETPQRRGECRRRAAYVVRNPRDWCGEFEQKR